MNKAFAAAADWLLRPGVAVAAAVLVLNDLVLKERYGNWATGKLSDVAGLYLVVFGGLACIALLREGASRRPGVQIGTLCGAAIALGVVKVTSSGAEAYGQLIGWMRSPVRALLDPGGSWALWSRPIEVIVDPTDLVALGVLLVAAIELVHIHRRQLRRRTS